MKTSSLVICNSVQRKLIHRLSFWASICFILTAIPASLMAADVVWSTPATTRPLTAFAYAFATNRMVTIDRDGEAQILTTGDHLVINKFHSGKAFRCHLSPDGSRMIVEHTTGVSVISTDSGKFQFSLPDVRTGLGPDYLVVSQDWKLAGARLPSVVGTRFGIFSLETGTLVKEVASTKGSLVQLFALSQRGELALFKNSDNASSTILRLADRTILQIIGKCCSAYAGAFGPSDEVVAIVTAAGTHHWLVENGTFLKTTGPGGLGISCCNGAISADFTMVANGGVIERAGSYYERAFITQLLPKPSSRELPLEFYQGFDNPQIAFSHDNSELGILHSMGKLLIWNPRGKDLPPDQISLDSREFFFPPIPDYVVRPPRLMAAAFSIGGDEVLTLRGDDDNWTCCSIIGTLGARDAEMGNVTARAGSWFGDNFTPDVGGISRYGEGNWSMGKWTSGKPAIYAKTIGGLFVQTDIYPLAATLSSTGVNQLAGSDECFSPPCNYFVWSETNRVQFVRPGLTPRVAQTLPSAGFDPVVLEFSHDDSLLVGGGSGGQITVWGPNGFTNGPTFKVSETNISRVTFSTDNNWILVGDAGGGISAWDLAKKSMVYRIPSGGSKILRIATDPGGKVFATADAKNQLNQWEIATGKLLSSEEFEGSAVTALEYSPNGDRMLLGQESTELRVTQLPILVLRTVINRGQMEIEWAGGRGPFMIQHRSSLGSELWKDSGESATDRLRQLPIEGVAGFYRIVSANK